MKLVDLDFNFHREGYVFISLAALLTCILGLVGGEELFFLGLLFTVWCCYFFRDPVRVTPTRAGLIISPADGKIVSILNIDPEADMGLDDKAYTRISIFLSVFDVHVNRIPADGRVIERNYRKGKFFNATRDKASVDNERMSIALELTGDHPKAGARIGVVQIAGFIARRIVCSAQTGDTFKAGRRYGIIRFGSRVDIYLPQGINPLVSVGQYMIGGETIIADCLDSEPARTDVRRE
jgi:phosphatidylserine decarboxylase